VLTVFREGTAPGVLPSVSYYSVPRPQFGGVLKPMKPIQYASVAGLCLLAGCNPNLAPSTPQSMVRRQTAAKLRNGMFENEMAAVLGQPIEFRAGNGARDDVAVYRVKDQTFTIYFYRYRLTRYVSSQQPVNR